ncbi:stromal interaction molecule 2-like isoform X4 [Portunus trituberculatus]|uniref:stromal interaction molecule 2-like isoform X4 n=1 Tax=Portunus trituberculatus TaxID=210409 RepID=UPI001E1CF467|nr:stromal interaction molecule 2-like isoform X4 [Portunus trituberculatus]
MMEVYLASVNVLRAYYVGLVVLVTTAGLTCGGGSGGGSGGRSWGYGNRVHQLTEEGCVVVDELCLVPEEVPNYEAIKSLHSQLDDDRSGDIDVSESVDFLKEELQYAKGYEKRQKVFHYNNDEYISVRELWYIWKKSEVHNWTVDQTVAWLAESVELKQYAQNFYENAVNGSSLPSTVLSVITPSSKRRNSRLAANNEQFLTKVLGIKDPKHRSKITIKAMDVVLFGPPKDTGSHLKDLVLVSLLTLALIGCFKAYQRNREYEGQLSEMLKDMEKLREAEENLHQLEMIMTTNVKNKESKEKNSDTVEQNHADEVQQLRLQLEEEREKNVIIMEQMKKGLEEADNEDHIWRAPMDLQLWLQLTYERERIACVKKQSAAREQFDQAREMCEKLNKQRRSLMGIMASVHGKMDNVDQAISQARTTMEEVTRELREREHRWKNIEMLAGCSITNNPGLHALELRLCPPVNGPPHSTYGSSIVHQLLSSQSALMFLTMGGCTGATSYYAGSSLSSSTLVRSPGDSLVDVPGGSGAMVRKRSQLIPRDSGSSLGSESSVTPSCAMHHSHTYSTGLIHHTLDRESMRRVSSTGSIGCISPADQDHLKDLQDSSAEETDTSGYALEGSSFTMGGSIRNKGPKKSQLTLNSEGGRAVSPSQVSLSTSPPPSMRQPGLNEVEKEQKTSTRRSPMLKSYSQDTAGSRTEATFKALTNSLEGGGKQVPASRRHSVTGCITGGRPLGPCVRRHSVSGCRLLPYHPKVSVLEETPFAKKFPTLSKFIPHGKGKNIRE